MKQTSVIAVTLAALFVAGIPAVAQHAGHDSATSGAAMSPDMMAQHQKMMAQHQEIGKLIDELAKDFSALQNENNAAQLKKKLADDSAKLTELQSKFQAASGMMGQSMGHSAMMQEMMQHQGQSMAGMHGQQQASATPTLPGQDAFGAIQEIVHMLEADPSTDWSKVNLESLRQHLIDMNEVTMKAEVAAKQVEGGLEIAVTGTGRTLAAIQRMVPNHAQMMNGVNGWATKTELLRNGVRLTVTSADPKETAHIRGLGFMGILVSGTHHLPHHMAMAKGEVIHKH
jgi:hypothetical protein